MQADQQTAATMAETTSQETLLDQIVEQDIGLEAQRFEYAQRFGAAAAASQYWSDAASMPQAAMKIMAGFELGLSASVALNGINIIKGKVSMSGELTAALLIRHGFTWKFGKHDETGCQIFCYHNGKPILNQDGSHAQIVFARADAERAGLTDKQGDKKDKPSMYDKYGADMYFNRCIMRYQRRFAPGVTKGIPIHTPDEIEEIAANEKQSAPQMPQRKQAEE